MKKLLSLLLSVTLIAGVSVPAHAIETTTGEEPPQAEASPIAVVASLDELIEAAENAEEGDKIAVSATITLDGESFTPSKQVTLVRSEGFTSLKLFLISGNQAKYFSVFLAGVCVVFGWFNVAVPKFFKKSHTASSP